MSKNKNLESQDQISKGLLRTPFAFITGGVPGLIANTIITAVSAKNEIDRETKHKEYLDSLKSKPTSEEDIKIRQKKNNIRWDFFHEQFKNVKKLGIMECSAIEMPSNKYCEFSTNMYAPKAMSIWIKENNIHADGIRYADEDFYNLLKKDMNDSSIKKYNLNGVKCYTVKTKPYFICH